LLAAFAALCVNGLLLAALTLAGHAEAEPSTNATPGQAAGVNAQVAKAEQSAKPTDPSDQAPVMKRKLHTPLARKLLPVHDFGGY
jgi:hypothetical protein